MQQEYSRLIANLSVVDEPIRSNLIKATSATKTALEALDKAVLNDSALKAMESFTLVVTLFNDLIEELYTATPLVVSPVIPPAGAKEKDAVIIDPES